MNKGIQTHTEASTGKEVTDDTERTINVVIRVVTENKPILIRKSSWCMVELTKREDVQVLLNQQVLFDPVKDRLVVFRKVTLKPTLDRVFEVRNIRKKKDLEDLEKHLLAEGHTIVSKSIDIDVWSSTMNDPVVWITLAPNTTWAIPTSITIEGKEQEIKEAQTCNICHADDHANRYCQWPKLYKSLLQKPGPKKFLH